MTNKRLLVVEPEFAQTRKVLQHKGNTLPPSIYGRVCLVRYDCITPQTSTMSFVERGQMKPYPDVAKDHR